METATMTGRNLEIDGMSGDACVQKVTGALKGVHGVSTQSVKVGGARIQADQAGCTAACAAIDSAGYKVREGACTGGAGETTPAVPDANSAPRSGGAPQSATKIPGGEPARTSAPMTAARPSTEAPAVPAAAKK